VPLAAHGLLLAPLLVRRFRPALVIAAGLALAVLGFGLLTRASAAAGLAVLVTGSFVYSAGVAPALTLGTDMIVGAASPERAGTAAAISETGSELGGALGIALLGVIGTTIYRSQVSGTLPAGVPPQAARAARETLAGAVMAAGHLPGQLRLAVLDAARQAFTHGLHAVAIVSAAIAISLAILDTVLLSRIRADSGSEQTIDPQPWPDTPETDKGSTGQEARSATPASADQQQPPPQRRES
jgi:DHA2 family multidrug resistance protein-like MFS transporter